MEGWVVCENAYGHLSQRALYVTVYVRVILPRNTNLKCSMGHVFRNGVMTAHPNTSASAWGIPFNVWRSTSNRNHDEQPETCNLVIVDQPHDTRSLYSTKTAFYRNLLFLWKWQRQMSFLNLKTSEPTQNNSQSDFHYTCYTFFRYSRLAMFI